MSVLNRVKCLGTFFPFLKEWDYDEELNRNLVEDPFFPQKKTQTVLDWANLKPLLSARSSILLRCYPGELEISFQILWNTHMTCVPNIANWGVFAS